MTDIVISEFMDAAAIERLAASFDARYDPTLVSDPARLHEAVGDARALIVRNQTQVDAALLDAAPRLCAIGRLGVGLDNIDTESCAARGVAVYPATDANVVSVAEYVITAMLLARRGAFGASGRVAAGEWPRAALVGAETAGSTLGIVGFGAIGQAVAARAQALSTRVLAFDPAPAPDAFDGATATRCATLRELLEGSDVVTLHVPLLPSTRHLVDKQAIASMRTHAWLVNTARGGVVDDAALAAALREGRLGGAVLDVFEDEPLPARSSFADLDNVILTPHIAGLTQESQARVGDVVATAIEQHLKERP